MSEYLTKRKEERREDYQSERRIKFPNENSNFYKYLLHELIMILMMKIVFLLLIILGANVVVGGDAPVKAMVAAIGQASNVMINTMYPNFIAIPSASIRRGNDTTVIVGADDR